MIEDRTASDPGGTRGFGVFHVAAAAVLGVAALVAFQQLGPPEPEVAPSEPQPSAAVRVPSTPFPSEASGIALINDNTGVLASAARYAMTVDGVALSFAVPVGGWYPGVEGGGQRSIDRNRAGPDSPEAVVYWTALPQKEGPAACDWLQGADIGESADDLAAVIASAPGTELLDGPRATAVDLQRAAVVSLSVRAENACVPAFLHRWPVTGQPCGPCWRSTLVGDVISAWVVEVQGTRLMIVAINHTPESIPARIEEIRPDELADEIRSIVHSIEFSPTPSKAGEAVELPDQCASAGPSPEVHPMNADFSIGRHVVTYAGFTFNLCIPSPNWEPYADIHLSKSEIGPQDAEGLIFFASPDGGGSGQGSVVRPCPGLPDPTQGTTAEAASAIAAAPGTTLISAPSQVEVGGQPAWHVAFIARQDVGCDPGFLFNWPALRGGALWVESQIGDRIHVWILEQAGRRLVIGGEVHPEATYRLEREIILMVESIQFE